MHRVNKICVDLECFGQTPRLSEPRPAAGTTRRQRTLSVAQQHIVWIIPLIGFRPTVCFETDRVQIYAFFRKCNVSGSVSRSSGVFFGVNWRGSACRERLPCRVCGCADAGRFYGIVRCAGRAGSVRHAGADWCRGAGRYVGHCARRRCCCHHSETHIIPSPIPTPTTDSRKRSRQFMAGGSRGFSCEMSRMTISVMVAIWPLT